MKTLIIFFVAISFLSPGFAQTTDQVPNLQRAGFYIYTSGQPTEEGFIQLAAMGIKTVINVLPERQCVRNEQEIVVASGMVYRSIPFELKGFRKETIKHFAEILKKAEKPVLIHCSTGNHVGGLWFAYRILIDKYPFDQALKEGRKIGMKPDLENELFFWLVLDEKRGFA
jgi:uncharacterized protein (TIGR01244 family)